MNSAPERSRHSSAPGVWCAVVVALAALYPSGGRAAEPLLRAGDLQGLSVTAATTYEGKALYGYIDGGADLYREYGFVRLTVQGLTLEGEEYTAEIYRMADDSAAFGIFSVSASDGSDSLGPHSASSLYLSQFASGPFFVRVVNYTGSAGAARRSEQMASVIRARTGTRAFHLPEVLSNFHGEAGRVRYVRGPLGIQNGGLDEWSDPLDGLEPYSGYLVSVGQTGRIALLQFAAPAASEEFLRRTARSAGTAGTPGHGFRKYPAARVLVVDGPEDLRTAILKGP
jgi:hypothetical protein